jgi:hypothetical protein
LAGDHFGAHPAGRLSLSAHAPGRDIRTLKEQLLWLQRLRTVGKLNAALRDFARRFNNHRIIGRIGYRTPAAHRHILLGEAP